jgi:hypothetical protein
MKQFLKKLSALTFFSRQERRKSAAASETDRPFCRLAKCESKKAMSSLVKKK